MSKKPEKKPVDPKMLEFFLAPCVSAKQMKDWVYLFLDVDLPLGHIDPESNSSPIEAMYDAYAAYRDDTCLDQSGYIWLASRDSGKTLCGSILNLMLVVHFKSQIAHLAAVKKQAEKNIEYTNTFVRKIAPYLDAAGKKIITDSKSKIQIENEDGSLSFVDVITANLAGGNSQHCPVGTYDELDTLSKQGVVGYRESLLVPTRMKGKGPLTIKYSTRKFAFGIFEQEIQNIQKTGEELRRWNIIDITENCPPSRHLPSEPKQLRYIGNELPQRNIAPDQYNSLTQKEKEGYREIEAYAGCAKCPLLQNCEMRLAHRPSTDRGGLYRDIPFTIRQFKTVSTDMAEAQLLCRKPSLAGLVYPRFSESDNVISIKQAWDQLTGLEDPNFHPTMEMLVSEMKRLEIPIYVGGDWGHSGGQAFIVTAVMPGGDWWILDTYSVPGLEFDEILELGISIRDKYEPSAWYMDTNQPMFIKTFKKNGMPCKDFDKDVLGGIESVRKQICDASNRRRMKVVKNDRNEFFLQMIRKHHFKLDTAGEPTDTPDDGPESHVGDSLRYLGQNLFGSKGLAPMIAKPGDTQQEVKPTMYDRPLQHVIDQTVSKVTDGTVKGAKNGKLFWST